VGAEDLRGIKGGLSKDESPEQIFSQTIKKQAKDDLYSKFGTSSSKSGISTASNSMFVAGGGVGSQSGLMNLGTP
jgi:hypothetical protein